MLITKHAAERIKERNDNVFSIHDAKRNAKIAWASGLTIEKVQRANADLANYMRRKKEKNGNRSKVRVYQNTLYIFCGRKSRLVTAYPLPESMRIHNK